MSRLPRWARTAVVAALAFLLGLLIGTLISAGPDRAAAEAAPSRAAA